MESSSNHTACLLKIESPTKGWEKSLEKFLSTIDGVSFTIDKRSKTVYVCGKSDAQKILEKIRKAGERGEIIWSNKKQIENGKDNLMGRQCYSSGSVNAPNGFSNYPMNHFQQYYPQYFPPPAPYTRQLHPPPPPPPPYEFHQSEPVAKSFPPTPAPPKNFTMGDLQSGCTIM